MMQGTIKLTCELEHRNGAWVLAIENIPRWLADDLQDNHRYIRWSSGRFPADRDAPCSVYMELNTEPVEWQRKMQAESEDAHE